MICCKCLEFEWNDPQEPVHTDGEGKEYCLFHAPAKHKGMSVEAFNEKVYERIRAIDPESSNTCDFSGTIFPDDISFSEFTTDSPLPRISFRACQFDGCPWFDSATFSGSASFSSATFSGDASFYSATFSGMADFDSATFSGDASFSLATFSGRASFVSATFSGASFSLATFSDLASFYSATFSGEASFHSATFSGKADFHSATFSGSTDFHLATFSGMADFHSATFSGRASFSLATFSGSTDFHLATFSDSASFDSATFSGRASFDSATFSGEASFHSATFSDSASFYSATFSGEASFHSATFSGKADFHSATFSGSTDFHLATFSGMADFHSATFSGRASFSLATFSGDAFFESATFNGEASFYSATFSGSASFGKASFVRAEFDNVMARAGLGFNAIEVACELRVTDMDLYWCDFLRTDMTNIHFMRCCWPVEDGRYRITTEDKPGKLEEVRDFYQGMKRKYKQEHNEAEVSQWHVAEKEVDLLLVGRELGRVHGIHDKAIWGLLWLMLQLYRISSRFGEHMVRAGTALLYVALAPLVILAVAKLAETGVSWTADWAQWGAVFSDWLRCMPLTKAGLGDAPTWKLWLFWVGQLLIAIQAALFAFALRNRFRR